MSWWGLNAGDMPNLQGMINMELQVLKELTEKGEREFEKAEGDDLDSTKLPSFVWIPDFISLAGSTMYEREKDREPGDVDMIVRAEESGDGFKVELDAGLRLKVDRVMKEMIDNSTSWTGAMTGPNWRYKPLWDLVLVPHEPDEVREINEAEFAERFYKEHPLDQCMECEQPPEFEMLWAESMGHVWFCRKHALEFIKKKVAEKFRLGMDSTDIVWVKACDGRAHEDRRENRNPDMLEALIEEEIDVQELQKKMIEKVHRETLKNPRANWRELLSDLRYLGNSAWPFLEDHDKWGTWTKEDVLKHFARIIDALRRLHFPIMPLKIGNKKFNTSYWKCYRAASKYMETKPPKADEVKLWDKKREEVLRKFEKFVRIFDISKKADEHIVCGIVYSPNEEDAQGDQASAEEIRKAAYDFMENIQKFGMNHVSDSIKWAFGKTPLARVLENYIAPCNLTIEGEAVKKGSWVLITRILSSELWEKIKTEEITGYSMAGKATV